MNGPYPLAGKILHVDLGERRVWCEPTAPLAERFLGGLGVSVYRLLKTMAPKTGPLDKESALAFGAGALVGTLAPTASRLSVNGLNVYSGGFGSASAGGAFAPELKFAGYDNLIVTGRARRPVYLSITDGEVAIEDARRLAGLTTGETADLLEARHGEGTEVAGIGPAGERHIKAANVIVSRNRAAARCGLGAIMGSKNLKAVAVKGSGGIGVADPQGFLEAAHAMAARTRRNRTARKLRKFGTPVSFRKWNAQGAVPVRNFQQTHMDPARAEQLTGESLRAEHIRKVFACFACPTPCSQYQEVMGGTYGGTRGEKIECQNIWDFGAKFDIDSLAAVIKASDLCTQYGLDISSASGVIAWAFECYQHGLLSLEETDGLELTWGNHGVLIECLRRLAQEEGNFGQLLAKGSHDAARALGRGSERFALCVKGQELAEELRPFRGWSLGIAVAERAGTHTVGSPLTERMDLTPERSRELFGVETAGNPTTYEGKAGLIVYYQRLHAALEGLGLCFFTSNWMGPEMPGPKDFAELYSLASGRATSAEELLAYGERIHNLQKLMNVKYARLSRADDVPQARFFEESASGAQEGQHLDHARWEAMLDEYYRLHDWDVATGRPTAAALAKRGLAEFADLLAIGP